MKIVWIPVGVLLLAEVALAQGILPSWMRRGGEEPPTPSAQRVQTQQAAKVPSYQPVITASAVAPNGEVIINIDVPQNTTASVLMNNFEIGGFTESSKRIKRFVPPGESSVVLKLTDEFGQTFTKELSFNRPRDAAAAELAMGSPTDAVQSSKLPPRAKKVAALVIGNSNYKTSPLANPKNDASAISAKLKGMGYNVKTLIDADRKELLKGLNQFREMAEKSDVGIFYYAGHGVQVGGTNYILPVDFDLVHGVASVQFDGVAINQVLDNFVPTETKLAFLDACRDNPLSRSLAKTRNAGALGLAPMESVSGTLISFATKDGAVALDGEGKHSPYTQALLTHLDDRVDVSVMLRRVRQKVIDTTRGKQMPWDYGSLVGDELVLGRDSR